MQVRGGLDYLYGMLHDGVPHSGETEPQYEVKTICTPLLPEATAALRVALTTGRSRCSIWSLVIWQPSTLPPGAAGACRRGNVRVRVRVRVQA